MKNNLLLFTFMACTLSLFAQENALTISGGYAFANIEKSDVKATGWRINGLYEFNPLGGMLSHGVSFGYIGTSAKTDNLLGSAEIKLNSWPVYYAPKVSIGNEKYKGFLKGALGMHFSGYNYEGALGSDVSTNDSGFYGGASIGGSVNLKSNIFINVEYEWAYMSNYYYKDGFINSIMGGIGMRF